MLHSSQEAASRGSQDRSPQTMLNGEVHDWYRFRLGFSDHLVSDLLAEFGATKQTKVLDPFCGTGTVLVECMKQGIDCAGIDANPATYFAAQVKTTWDLDPGRVLELLDDVENSFERHLSVKTLVGDPTFRYLEHAGFLKRGWIETEPLLEAVALKLAIRALRTSEKYRRLLLLALLSGVVEDGSNLKFGPELYCATRTTAPDVLGSFIDRVEAMATDLRILSVVASARATVFLGDSRECGRLLGRREQFDMVICSPPYPAEHDYTRNTRMELALLEHVVDRESLREIKHTMIRSHTKGLYNSDNDRQYVKSDRPVQSLVAQIETAVKGKTYGFARLYPRVAEEYFGGVVRHLRNLRNLLAPDALCAYIVGDQSSYLGVHIPTANVLAHLAEQNGYQLVEIRHWRHRWSSSMSRQVGENILILRCSRHA
jgi:16S rRNA G966 N2-methylase RsmD